MRASSRRSARRSTTSSLTSPDAAGTEELGRLIAELPPERLYPTDPDSPLYGFRSSHRGEHLDDIERALKS